jgi:heat shock protein HslJ
MLRGTLLLLTLTALLTACAGQPAAQTDPLVDTSWLLETLSGQAPVAGTAITLSFGAGSRLAGSDGCNQYNAAYTLSGSNLTVKPPIATTLMACADDVMQQGSAYIEALGKVATYQMTAGKLSLSDSGGNELATFGAQSTDLAGTSWDVISYNNGKQAVVSVMAGTTLTATFGADGNLTGFAGCNDYNATYAASGKKTIEIGPVASTRKFCEQPAGVMDQESQYLTALSTAATYTIDGSKLELRTSEGALAAQFNKAGQ